MQFINYKKVFLIFFLIITGCYAKKDNTPFQELKVEDVIQISIVEQFPPFEERILDESKNESFILLLKSLDLSKLNKKEIPVGDGLEIFIVTESETISLGLIDNYIIINSGCYELNDYTIVNIIEH